MGHVVPLPDGGIMHLTRCWPCMLGQCPGGAHDWADDSDIRHAAKVGHPSPAGQSCACDCTKEPERRHIEPEPDIDEVSLDAGPCPECGETGACRYDSEGRPMIHAHWLEDEDEDRD